MKQLSLLAVSILTTLFFLQEAKAQTDNTKYGSNTLIGNTTGSYNAAFGTGALYKNYTGSYNSASGAYALNSNTTGFRNTASGNRALYFNTTGNKNTANGFQALTSNTTGTYNTASGFQALFRNTNGAHNIGAGNYALGNNTTGSYNTAVGDSAGVAYIYNNGTFLGYKTTTSISGLSNITVIGNGASATASNQVRIGNSSVTSIGGKVGWTTLSDGRFKKNIQEDVPGLAFITKLKPVTYTLDIDAIDKASGVTELPTGGQASAAKEKHTGFVAQDVEKAAQDLKYDFGGVDKPKNDKDFYGLRYAEFVVPLVKAVQEQQEQIEQQQQQIEELKQLVNKLANGQSVNTNTITSSYLEQNRPNPVSGTTTIRYHIPETSSSANLTLTNAKGQVVKTVNIYNKGTGQLNLNTQALAAGTYHYTLYVDGRQADSKRLVITR